MNKNARINIEKCVKNLEDKLEEERTKRISLRLEKQKELIIKSEALQKIWTSFSESQTKEKEKLVNFENTLAQLEKKINQLESFCGDYQLLWKIRGFSQVYEDAKSGLKATVQSPQFDSHRNGYKLQLSIFPYGDGYAIGTAMSIYISILKGNADFILPWPFCHPVTFVLVNQADSQNHSMTYDPKDDERNSVHLCRPTAERNRAIGFKKFINLDDLFEKGFIANDTIFIKVSVDLTNLNIKL